MALASVLILQEMGLTVDIAADRDAALAWVRMARYAAVICGGNDATQLTDFALKVRAASPYTQIFVVAQVAPGPLAALGVELLRPPLNVNALVDRLRPLAA